MLNLGLIRKAFLYWNTLRHVKFSQIAWRIKRRLQSPRVDRSWAPATRAPQRDWVEGCSSPVSMVEKNTFFFLNEKRSISKPDDWNADGIEKLWLYNAHYFNDLNAVSASERILWHLPLIEKWLTDNPPAQGVGWEPYPLSLRIVNWIKFDLASGRLSPRAKESLAVQIRCLNSQLEFHLLGNHLLANAKALIFAGTYFKGDEASRWLDIGLSILSEEIKKQILPDGGHFERSTMYHAIVLEDFLDIHNVLHVYSLDDRLPTLPIMEMRVWLRALCHPDGGIAFFNDAAFGIAPGSAQLETYATRLGFPALTAAAIGMRQFGDSGYLRLETGPAVALLDVAPVGPDYLPGHAHADTLSFELSVGDNRVFVNTGTSCYGLGLQRQFERSTAAHNTLSIDGANSSEVWAGFRVARRARPTLEVAAVNAGAMCVTASHDGYRRLPGRNRHRRHWRLEPDMLEIIDEVSGDFEQAQAYFHLHPAVELLSLEDRRIAHLRLANATEVSLSVIGGELLAEAAHWHPEFGVSQSSIRLVGHLHGARMKTVVEWWVAP